MFCAQCGKQVPDGAKFCPGCGANVQGDAAAAKKPKSGAGLKLAVAGLIVVAAAAGGYVMLAPGEKTPAIEKAPAISPKPEAAAPEQKAPATAAEKPPEPPPPPVAEPQPPAKDPADVAAAHKALDQRIAEEEAAAKQAAGKK